MSLDVESSSSCFREALQNRVQSLKSFPVNRLAARAREIASQLGTYFQSVEDSGIWDHVDKSPNFAEELSAYLIVFASKIIKSDGKITDGEITLIKYMLPDGLLIQHAVVSKLIKDFDQTHDQLDNVNQALPMFAASVALDLKLGTEKTAEVLKFFEEFGQLVIAADGTKGELEVRQLGKMMNRLKDLVNKFRALHKLQFEADRKEDQAAPSVQEVSKPDLETLLTELRSMIGLQRAKEEVTAATNLVRVRQMRQDAGLPTMPMALHMVFTGNPGTGKTTVARLIAQIYRELGLLEKGHLTEVDRSGLVGGYVGQTALKVQEVVQEARGGVLFIDEAYALKPDQQDSYGQEAINTLLKTMEDHRDDLVVIVAGYTEQMNEFLETNPGLRSRFNRYVHFDDYTGDELLNIFMYMSEKNGYTSTPMVTYQLKGHFEKMYAARGKNFGNARDVRNIFESILKHQAARLMTIQKPTADDLSFLDLADIAWLFERSGSGTAPRGHA